MVSDRAALEELLLGRWIDCLVISEEQGPFIATSDENIGDFRVSPTKKYPGMAKNYLELAQRLVAEVTYFCRNNSPLVIPTFTHGKN